MGRRKKEAGIEPLNRIYFDHSTEEAIISYNNSNDMDEREIIYKTRIDRPLNKLAENVINRFKFPYIEQSFEDTKRQVVSFLVINLSKYTQDKGKAFSYLSVIAKNYLILHNNNAYKQQKRSISLSESGGEYVPIEEMTSLEAPDAHVHEDSKEFVVLMIKYWEENLTKIFKKKRDIDIANAVVELFRNAESIENFNKKALYLMIREMTDCKTSYITKVVNKMRVHTANHLREYYSNGVIGPS
jgi:hypothetical protein